MSAFTGLTWDRVGRESHGGDTGRALHGTEAPQLPPHGAASNGSRQADLGPPTSATALSASNVSVVPEMGADGAR